MCAQIQLFVGLGASAGGLKALEAFVRAVPLDSGCCYVVVQHLSPDFKSVLEDLLGRQTQLPVHRVEDGMAAAPDAIFLIPPKKLLTIRAGHFQLLDRDAVPANKLPINLFLESLAAEAGRRAVGVVLSGGGSDGATGVSAIHEAGGLVLVQRPDSAEFDSMPRNALAATVVDHILDPGDMPAAILDHARAPARSSNQQKGSGAAEDRPLDRVMALLHRVSGIDFSQYKMSTVDRRIDRRMKLLKIPDLAAYADLLATRAEELNALYGDMLIGVTEFFRDADAFARLKEQVAPGLLAAGGGAEVRAWIAGCATGEEAYSIAIVLDEVARAAGFAGKFSLFATDVHQASLDFAAAGVYGREQLRNVSPERFRRYFIEETPGQCRIVPEIRKRLVFARHNLVSDPPFTRLDLVSCRNLLIYFNPDLQDRAIRLLYFALRENGCLFLGPSEGLGRTKGLQLEVLDDPAKLFRKAGSAPAGVLPLPERTASRPIVHPPAPVFLPRAGEAASRQLLAAYDHILRQHVPAGLLVNEGFEVLHYFGAGSAYLLPLEGRAHENLLHRAEGDLRLCLSTLLPRVCKTGLAASSRNVRARGPAGDERIDVVAEPVPVGPGAAPLLHVSFVNARSSPPPLAPGASAEAAGGNFVAGDEIFCRIRDLEAELQSTRENLQTAVEELQTSNEELQASNEELTSSNEELQSTNEELHAVNEELHGMNSEFERKNIELQQLNDDLNNMSVSTDTGTIFVDRELRIRKFNPAIQRIFRLLPQDVGRPISHIAYHLDGQEEMLREVGWVLAHGELRQQEVRTRDGRWLLKRVLPFLASSGEIQGVVLTFTDIDETKALQDRLDLAMDASGLVWWDWNLVSDSIVVRGGPAGILGYAASALPKTRAEWQAATHPDDEPRLQAALQSCLDPGVDRWSCEHRLRAHDGSWSWVLNGGKVVERDSQQRPVRMLGTTQDITARHAAEEIVHRDATLLSQIQEAIIGTDCEGIVTYWNEGATRLYGWSAGEMLGRPATERFAGDPAAQQRAAERFREALAAGDLRRELEEARKDGTRVWTEARLVRINDSHGQPAGLVAVCHDVTPRKRAEQDRQRLEEQLFQAQKIETIGTLAGGIAHDFNNIIATIIGFTELAMSPRRPDTDLPHLHEGVLKAAHRARDLVRRILTFSRFNKPERCALRLDEVIRESAKMIRATLPATVELGMELGENLPAALADANQLHQVILNLATNGAHAMRGRGGKLTLRLGEAKFDQPCPTAFGPLPPGAYLRLEISDTGHGIDPETLKKIFDPFFTTKPIGEGTGLGLSIVHGIIEGHGGGVDVTSTLQVGTTFTLYLPALAPGAAAGTAGAPAADALPLGRGQRIAVIDDEEDLGKLTQANLQGLGYDAACFPSAESFYADFSSSLLRVEMVVTDQTMPHMTGLQLAQKLRADGHGLPILIVSGFSRDLGPEVLAAVGRAEMLAKPYDLAQLAAVVHRLLLPPLAP